GRPRGRRARDHRRRRCGGRVPDLLRAGRGLRDRVRGRSTTMTATAAPVRVLVAADDPLVRTGTVGILDTDPAIEVVAQSADGAEALRMIDTHRPDVALFDIQMPGMSGLEALKRLRSDGSALPCLFVTTFGEDDYIAEAIRLDADG